ncbi:MAG: hypothetical protein ACOC8H_01855 [bacterium]
MITNISIENFKGIRERIEFDLKPLTLLFRPDSAGKSTILHALHYAREILDRRNPSPVRTVVGGKLVDLEGSKTSCMAMIPVNLFVFKSASA